jgi:predicted metal-binding protein
MMKTRQRKKDSPMACDDDLKGFVQHALALGVDDAKVIPAASIVTAAWVRMKCQFGCEGYNQSHCCPPHTPTPRQTQEVIDCYARALLLHCKGDTSPTRIVIKLEREIFLSGYYKALGFGTGPCRLCRTCPPEECRHRDKARPSMEACGIDVYATARAHDFPIEVVKDYACDTNYYGLVLID